jgi:ParB family chromosome partitioning protein
MKTRVDSITIGPRTRRDMGTLDKLAASIREQGLLQPIGITEDKLLVFGERRLRACRDILGWEEIDIRVVSVTSIVEGECAENEMRKNFTTSERVAIADAVAETIGNRQGRRTDIELRDNGPEVASGVRTREAAAQRAGFGSDADYRRAAKVVECGTPELVKAMDEGIISISHAASLADKEPTIQQRTILNIESGAKPHVSHNSGDNEWYTPKEYTEAAKVVMGNIDLDPASSEEANAVVGADRFFSAENNGLGQDWAGRIYLNPPYQTGLVDKFAEKLLLHIGVGDVSEAIVLVNNATETQWFQSLLRESSAVCFPSGRVRFWHPRKISATPLQGQAVLYLGTRREKFCRGFAGFGIVCHVI